MLAAVRDFASRVRRRRPLELGLVILLGLLGMAMSGTSSRAYTPLRHSAPLQRPVEETGRVSRLVVVQAAQAVREANPLVVRASRPRPPRPSVPSFTPPPRLRLDTPPARVRGPPLVHA